MTYAWRIVCVLVALFATPGLDRVPAWAEENEASDGAAPAPGAASLAVEIARQAESVAARLRTMAHAVSDDTQVSALEREVFEYRQRVSDQWTQTDRVLGMTPRRAPLEALASSWDTLRAEIVGLQTIVDAQGEREARDVQTLERDAKSWTWTLDHARSAGASAQTVARVEATLAAIAATRAQVDQYGARLLALQDGVNQAVDTSDDAIARVADARRRAVTGVLAQRERPIWRIRAAWTDGGSRAEQLARVSDEIAVRVESLRLYAEAHPAGLVATVLLALVLTLVLLRSKGDSALPESALYAVRAPVETALLITLALARPLRPDPPLALQQAVILIGLPFAVSLLRPSLDARFASACHALIALFVVNVARGLLSATPVLEQVVLIVEMGVAAALLFWLAARIPGSVRAPALRSPGMRRAGGSLLRIAGAATSAAAIAAGLGYLELADLVGGGALYLVCVAIGLLAIRLAFGAVVALALSRTALARLRTVERRGALGEYVIGRILDVVAVAFWIFIALQRFELLDAAAAALRSAFEARLQLGALDLSVGRVLGFVTVVLAAWLTSRIVVLTLDEDVYPRLELPRGVPYALSTLVRYGLLLAGFLTALVTLGFDLTHLTVLLSAFGLGLGFGMQHIVNNFVSGLILLFERPVQVGDSVQLGDLSGRMLRIGMRSSTIRTAEGAEVILPNSKLAEDKVTNWTLSDRKRRVDVTLRVAYGTEAEVMLALLVGAAQRDPRVLADPEPEALLTAFGEKGVEYQLRAWTEDPHWTRLRSDLGVAIQTAMREKGIEGPAT